MSKLTKAIREAAEGEERRQGQVNYKDHMQEDTNRPHEIPEWKNLEVHPFVSLLIARMESHPEEFYQYVAQKLATGKITETTNPKWAEHNKLVERTKPLWNRKEKWLYNHALRQARMNEAHTLLMAKLLS